MSPEALYLACVLGAVGLYVLLRPGRRPLRVAGSLLALGVAGWLLVALPRAVGGEAWRPEFFHVAFSLIAVAAAIRMITHTRPVYSALYFVMVVLSSAGLFLLLQAEFMAFALVIVYAGAILVTYLFVLMLAQQAPAGGDASAPVEYDRIPREPAAAVVVGFIMIALLGTMARDVTTLPPQMPEARARAALWAKAQLLPERLMEQVLAVEPGFTGQPVADADGAVVSVDPEGTAFVRGTVGPPPASELVRVNLPDSAAPDNIQLVGLDLVSKFPVSLELAGVILLLAMFGAVVLARRQIELGEDEVREAAGLPRLGFHEEDAAEPLEGGGQP